jgi:hypothetical protein
MPSRAPGQLDGDNLPLFSPAFGAVLRKYRTFELAAQN